MSRGMDHGVQQGVVVAQDGAQLRDVVQSLHSHHLRLQELFGQYNAEYLISRGLEELMDRVSRDGAHFSGMVQDFLQHVGDGGVNDAVVYMFQDCHEH